MQNLELLSKISDFLDELIRDAIMWSPSDQHSDFRCRFCGSRTATNNDFDTTHYDSCEIHRARELRDALIEEMPEQVDN